MLEPYKKMVGNTKEKHSTHKKNALGTDAAITTVSHEQKSNPLPKIILLILWVGGVYLAVQYLLAFLIRFIFQPTTNTPLLQTLYAISCYIISILIILFVPKKINKKWGTNFEELGLIELPTWTDLGLAPVGFFLYVIFANILVALFSIFPWFSATERQDVGYNSAIFGPDRILALTSLVIIAPIVEEIIFRGFLYGKLKKNLLKNSNKKTRKERIKVKLKIALAILITSLLFAIMHRQWNVGINVFALSVVLCLFREITGTIYAGIIVHMLKNAIAFYLLYVIGMG